MPAKLDEKYLKKLDERRRKKELERGGLEDVTNEEKLVEVIESMTAFMPKALEELKRMDKVVDLTTRKGRKMHSEILSLEERMKAMLDAS